MNQSSNVLVDYLIAYWTRLATGALLAIVALCSCYGQEKQPNPILERERNIPVRLSVKLVDQFGVAASGVSCLVQSIPSKWWHVSGDKYEDSYSEKDMHEERVYSSSDGTIFYKDDKHRAPLVVLGIDDTNYMKTHVKLALLPYIVEKYMDPRRDVVHKFDRENPAVIHIWRRIGFRPLVCYDDRNNEFDLTSAIGAVRFDLTTFQPVKNGGDIILKWEIGNAVPPDNVVAWIKRPNGWGRQLHYTITAVDGRIWSIDDDLQWQSAHGIVPDQMPPGQPEIDVKTTLPAGGQSERQRFLLVSRNDKLCAKASLAFSLRDAHKGLVRVNFANTVVNPAGPPSLEIQPSNERDYLEGDARQQITTINEKRRSIGSGPLPSPGPTADVAWATYEKVCKERGIKPIPRPASE